jgi:hypothetical protein
MRSALRVALWLAALGAVAPAVRADWLVLVGGKRIKTEGAWTLKGDLLTVHETSGRILTVGTSTVDTAACLKANGGKLRLETVAVPMPAAGPQGPDIRPQGAPPARGDAYGSGADTAGATGPSAPAATGNAATGRSPRDDRLVAAKAARQARLQRELRYKQIFDGCTHMFIADRAGFERCVDSQTKVPSAPPRAATPRVPPAQR